MSYVSRKSWKNRSSGLGYSDKRNGKIRRLILFVFLFFLLFEIVTSLFIISFKVDSISMEPTIPSGAVILAFPLAYSPEIPFTNVRLPGIRKPLRGDLVIASPAYISENPWYELVLDSVIRFFTLQNRGFNDEKGTVSTKSVKRIVGIPGDTVKMEDSVMFIKPKGKNNFFPEKEVMSVEYSIENYIKPDLLTKDFPLSGNMAEITLGQDEYFIAGDNRSLSNDSYYWGPVKISNLKARIILEYAPEIKIPK